MNAIIYEPQPNAKRIKFHIPYKAVGWRKVIKQMNGAFYHGEQKLWSLPNTSDNRKSLKELFANKLEINDESAKPAPDRSD